MTSKSFYFDGTRCSGCKTCEFACKDYNDTDIGFAYRKNYEISGGETSRDENGVITTSLFAYPISLACNHCAMPACTEVCPTRAMHKDPETGMVVVDSSKCIGCGYCEMACPYNAPKVSKAKGHCVKCDGCIARVSAGLKPVCVEACPCQALNYVDTSAVADNGAGVADIFPLPSHKTTVPNLYILLSPDAQKANIDNAIVANPAEVH